MLIWHTWAVDGCLPTKIPVLFYQTAAKCKKTQCCTFISVQYKFMYWSFFVLKVFIIFIISDFLVSCLLNSTVAEWRKQSLSTTCSSEQCFLNRTKRPNCPPCRTILQWIVKVPQQTSVAVMFLLCLRYNLSKHGHTKRERVATQFFDCILR